MALWVGGGHTSFSLWGQEELRGKIPNLRKAWRCLSVEISRFLALLGQTSSDWSQKFMFTQQGQGPRGEATRFMETQGLWRLKPAVPLSQAESTM